MGIEPTHPGKTGTPTDLKSARATRPRALPPGLSRKAVFEGDATRVLFCAPSDRGAVAQLGERLNGIQEVDGSIPFSSTKLLAFLDFGYSDWSCSPAAVFEPLSSLFVI
jgi:hypothetical protein